MLSTRSDTYHRQVGHGLPVALLNQSRVGTGDVRWFVGGFCYKGELGFCFAYKRFMRQLPQSDLRTRRSSRIPPEIRILPKLPGCDSQWSRVVGDLHVLC